eukprot:GFUD01030237.1.p1 GENE.GFUD01030237.1~~GFUD01030237.1.p1  ORF type:complete len:347 (-),score=75.78 GFUD01030237.1:201-1241(-)
MSQANVQLQPGAGLPKHDGPGSRDSSEFEFVMKNNQAAPNPLLMTSNQPSVVPTPSIVNLQMPNQPILRPQLPPQSYHPQPMPHPTLPQSTSLPSNLDLTSVSTIVAESPSTPGMFGWVKGTGFLSNLVEKTKSVTENVITTLDPQMKEFIHSGGDVELIVASDKENKVGPVREAFQKVFGHATVYGLPSKSISIAEQPVGFASGKQAASERISTLRKSGSVGPNTVILSVENFLYEVNEEIWIDLSCLVLSDPLRKITLQSYSQPTNVDAKYIQLLKAGTPENYPRQWSGFAVPIGQVMAEELNVPHTSWQEAVTGVNKKQLLFLAAQGIAGLYKRSIQEKVDVV